MTATAAATGAGRPDRLLTGPVRFLLAAVFSGLTSFFLLLSVVPGYAEAVGGGRAGAGAATAALLTASVTSELTAMRLVHRFSYRAVYVTGLVVLGLPPLLLTVSPWLPAVLAANAVRGLGFGIVVVLGAALTATLTPAARRGEAFGLLGVAIGVPGVAALPAGVYLADRIGYAPVFLLGGAVALAGVAAAARLPARVDGSVDAGPATDGPAAGGWAGPLWAARIPALRRTAFAFSTSAMVAGVVVTFLPLAVGDARLASAALFGYAATSVTARLLAGRWSDRRGPRGLLPGALLLTVAGVLLLVRVDDPAAAVAGAVLFGTGFGVAQAASLVLMFGRVPADRYGAVSSLWNASYDAGMGLGAAGFGVLAGALGYPAAFAVLLVAPLAGLAGLAGVAGRRRGARPGAPAPPPP